MVIARDFFVFVRLLAYCILTQVLPSFVGICPSLVVISQAFGAGLQLYEITVTLQLYLSFKIASNSIPDVAQILH